MPIFKKLIFRSGLGVFTYIPEYQAVIDYAVSQSIATPTHVQNLINQAIIQNFLWEEVWLEFDVFYFFRQEVGTPYEFMTLNWLDPANHRLTNVGGNDVVFVGGSGMKITGGNDQMFSTNYTPSTDSVNYETVENSTIFGIFDASVTFEGLIIVGGKGTAVTQVNLQNSANNNYLMRVHDLSNKLFPFTQAEVNQHYHISNETTTRILNFIDGEIAMEDFSSYTPKVLVNIALDIFGYNNNGSHIDSNGTFGMEYFALGSTLKFYQKEIYQILTGTYYDKKVDSEGTLAFDTGDVTPTSLMFPNVYLSSDFPSLTTTKDYIVLYATEHDAGDGGCYWGDADNVDLSDLTERGLIIDGDQAETPYLVLRPDDIDGDIIHFTYHPDQGHPDSGGYQQTRLLTRSGGLLHAAGWTDRGKVLGIVSPPGTEDHTGYLKSYKLGDDSLIGFHATKGIAGITESTIARYGVSSSVDGRATWTRENSYVDATSYMPYLRSAYNYGIYFEYGGNKYCLGMNRPYDTVGTETHNRIGLYSVDANYEIDAHIGNISIPDGGNQFHIDFGAYIESGVIHIYYIHNNGTELYHTTWQLSNLD